MRYVILALILVVQLRPALADDEGSEHSASVYGAAQDTLGVTIAFRDGKGWEMTIRPQPGAPTRTVMVPIPAQHAHYAVFVAPGRAAVAFVETSAGMSRARTALAPSDGLAWVIAPDGKILASWTYGKVLTRAELTPATRTAGHLRLVDQVTATTTGLELVIAGSKRTLVLDAAKHTLAPPAVVKPAAKATVRPTP